MMTAEQNQKYSPALFWENRDTGIRYHRRGEHWMPNIAGEMKKPDTGKWGRMWILFMRENHNALYNRHLMQGDLYVLAAKVQEEAEEQIRTETEAIRKTKPGRGSQTFLDRSKKEEMALMQAEEETVRNLVLQVR